MKLDKAKKGFTLVELVVVIAILGILAGIAIPRFMEATKAARGAKIVADMRTIESAVNIYYVKYGAYPSETQTDTDTNTNFSALINNGTWPKPPVGDFSIVHTIGDSTLTTGTCKKTTTYRYYKTSDSDVPGDVELYGSSGLTNSAKLRVPTVTELLSMRTI